MKKQTLIRILAALGIFLVSCDGDTTNKEGIALYEHLKNITLEKAQIKTTEVYSYDLDTASEMNYYPYLKRVDVELHINDSTTERATIYSDGAGNGSSVEFKCMKNCHGKIYTFLNASETYRLLNSFAH